MNHTKPESSNVSGLLNQNECVPSIGMGTSDEDSFVVLDRSPSYEPNGRPDKSIFSNDSNARPVHTSGITYRPSGPTGDGLFSMNTAPGFKNQPLSNFSIGLLSMDMSPEEIQTKLNDVLRENLDLKETLHQNNLAMKQQLATLRMWQEAVHKSHDNTKEKFVETKGVIIKLRAENEDLKSSLKVLHESKSETNDSEVSLQAVNAALTSQVNALQTQIVTLTRNNQAMKNAPISRKEQELISLTEQLNRQLEIAERSRRQMSMDIEKLQAQKARLERDIVILNVDLEAQKQRAEAVEKKFKSQEPKPAANDLNRAEVETLKMQLKEYQDVIEKMTNHQMDQEANMKAPSLRTDFTDHVKKPDALLCDLPKQTERYSSLGSWLNVASENVNWDQTEYPDSESMKKLQFELNEVRKALAEEQIQGKEKAKMLSEAQQQFQNLFSDYQSVLQDLEDLNQKPNKKTDERQSLSYYEVQVKGFMEKIDNMTAQIMNLEDALTRRNQNVTELTEKNQQLEAENETIPVLQIQMQVYQADFNAEREARESLAGEKERLAEDLRNLQRRNQQLLNELKLYQQNYSDQTQQSNVTNGWNTISSPGRNRARENTPPSPGPQDF